MGKPKRLFNFSAGPAVLPESVLEKIASEMVTLPGVGSSIMEVSHRGKVFTQYLQSAQDGLRELLSIPADYEILFLQGGARLQFAMIPMNFLTDSGKKAAYTITGSWGKQALREAQLQGNAETIWSGEQQGFKQVPQNNFQLSPNDYQYHYYVSNETIEGVQFKQEPADPVPLICDASSDFLHKKIDISKYAMIYACAQKNAGAAGLTIVIIRKDLVESGRKNLPGYLSYRSHCEAGSLFNTPPTFAIYVFSLILDWLDKEIGGLDKMHQLNQDKAELVYKVIDQTQGFFAGHAAPDSRSLMNIVFTLSNEQLQKKFIEEADRHGLTSLAGHRSVGGIRASLYNAMPLEGAQTLADFMNDFATQYG
ncbi:MAG: 3-phosphoserine/phosphohydroxythreonine transaminase [Planctomycetota bacterium]|nr:3-phosphoserine/phosphohydroxythreonine transaminase [Planctomycetota bacterium]